MIDEYKQLLMTIVFVFSAHLAYADVDEKPLRKQQNEQKEFTPDLFGPEDVTEDDDEELGIVFMDFDELNYISTKLRNQYLERLAKAFASPEYGIRATREELFRNASIRGQWQVYEEKVNALCLNPQKKTQCQKIAAIRLKVLQNPGPHFGE